LLRIPRNLVFSLCRTSHQATHLVSTSVKRGQQSFADRARNSRNQDLRRTHGDLADQCSRRTFHGILSAMSQTNRVSWHANYANFFDLCRDTQWAGGDTLEIRM